MAQHTQRSRHDDGIDPTAGPDITDQLAQLNRHQMETLSLLRQLIEMLLPKGESGGPKLEDLIAGLVQQQTRMLLILRQIALDTQELLRRNPSQASAPLDGARGSINNAR